MTKVNFTLDFKKIKEKLIQSDLNDFVNLFDELCMQGRDASECYAWQNFYLVDAR